MKVQGASASLACLALIPYGAFALNYNQSLNSQVRSAFHGFNGMTISWNTYSKLKHPTVKYGVSPSALTETAKSKVSMTYNTSLTYNNHVLLSDLLPNTHYYYMPTDLIEVASQPFTFTTGRPLGDNTAFSTAFVADMGAMGDEGLFTSAGQGIPSQDILLPGEQNTIQSLTSEQSTYEFLVHVGDLAYADTWLTETQQGFINGTATYDEGYRAYESILDDFYDQMTNVTTLKAYMVAPGNHEANCVDGMSSLCMPGQENFTGFRAHFRMPSDVATQAPTNLGVSNMWYSFDHGMVHFVMINSETDFSGSPDDGFPAGPFGAPGQQVSWLQKDLAAVNRTITPWVVLGIHRPWYTSGGTCPTCQSAFETTINQYDVDLVFSGHYHVYERNSPIATGGKIDPAGLDNPSAPWYIVNGIGGHYGGLNPFNNLSDYQQFGLSIDNATYGWSRLTFHNCTHMSHELVNSSSNAVLDTATLFKNRTDCALTNNYVLPGYEAAEQLPGAIPASHGLLDHRSIGPDFNPSLCALACNEYATHHRKMCNFFNIFQKLDKGVSKGFYCRLFSKALQAGDATQKTLESGSKKYVIDESYGYQRSSST